MKLAAVSEEKLLLTFRAWNVDKEYAEPMYNYLVHGFSPGSFFTSVLANDFTDAVARSHPGNTITALKKLVGWIRDYVPREAWGSYERVDAWLKATEEHRRQMLEAKDLVYTPVMETLETLKCKEF